MVSRGTSVTKVAVRTGDLGPGVRWSPTGTGCRSIGGRGQPPATRGSNAAARHSRGVESLTIRPLRILVPGRGWVTVRIRRRAMSGNCPVARPRTSHRWSRPGNTADDSGMRAAGPGSGRGAARPEVPVRPSGRGRRAGRRAAPPEPSRRTRSASVSHAERVPRAPGRGRRRRVRSPADLHVLCRRSRRLRRRVCPAVCPAAVGRAGRRCPGQRRWAASSPPN